MIFIVCINETSLQFDPALISHNGACVAQILVEGFSPFIRSRAFETFVVDDLMGLGGSPVGFDSAVRKVIAMMLTRAC